MATFLCTGEIVVMLENQEPDQNIEDLTDAEIYSGISYLEPESTVSEKADDDNGGGVAVAIILRMFVLGLVAFIRFYCCTLQESCRCTEQILIRALFANSEKPLRFHAPFYITSTSVIRNATSAGDLPRDGR